MWAGCTKAAAVTLVLCATAAMAGNWDGTWRGDDGQWTLELAIRGGEVGGQATQGRFSWSVRATVEDNGAVRGTLIPPGQMQQDRKLSGTLPRLTISAGNAWSSGGTVTVHRVP